MGKISEFFGISGERIICVFKREFRNYYNTPIGYIFGIIFLVFTGILFFYWPINFWERGEVDMTQYFTMAVFMFSIFIPAVSMRLWAEESRTGTIETLLTLPFKDIEIILGKFLGATAFLAFILLLSITIPITLTFLGEPDYPIIITGYIVTIIVGAAYIAIGLILSSLLKDQITAFVVTLICCFIFTFSGWEPVINALGDVVGTFAAYVSLYGHFDNMKSGFLDFKDLIYFISFIGILLFLNKVVLNYKRSGKLTRHPINIFLQVST